MSNISSPFRRKPSRHNVKYPLYQPHKSPSKIRGKGLKIFVSYSNFGTQSALVYHFKKQKISTRQTPPSSAFENENLISGTTIQHFFYTLKVLSFF
jgi:hypothetical protein